MCFKCINPLSSDAKDEHHHHPHLKGLSEEGPLLHHGPLDALQAQLHLLAGGRLHVQKEVQQGADQPGRLGLADGDQERPHKLQQPAELWRTRPEKSSQVGSSSSHFHYPMRVTLPPIQTAAVSIMEDRSQFIRSTWG